MKTVKIILNGKVCSVVDAALNVIDFLCDFYKDFSDEVKNILEFEKAKFINAENRYAWKIKELYGKGYVKKGIELAKKRQMMIDV